MSPGPNSGSVRQNHDRPQPPRLPCVAARKPRMKGACGWACQSSAACAHCHTNRPRPAAQTSDMRSTARFTPRPQDPICPKCRQATRLRQQRHADRVLTAVRLTVNQRGVMPARRPAAVGRTRCSARRSVATAFRAAGLRQRHDAMRNAVSGCMAAQFVCQRTDRLRQGVRWRTDRGSAARQHQDADLQEITPCCTTRSFALSSYASPRRLASAVWPQAPPASPSCCSSSSWCSRWSVASPV